MAKTYTDEEIEEIRIACPSNRMKKFAEIYAVCLNATQAATEAGYSARTAGLKGSNLKNDPRIKAYYEALLCQKREELKVTKKDQYDKLVELYEAAIAKGQITAAARIIEIQNKMLGIDQNKEEEKDFNFTALFGGQKI